MNGRILSCIAVGLIGGAFGWRMSNSWSHPLNVVIFAVLFAGGCWAVVKPPQDDQTEADLRDTVGSTEHPERVRAAGRVQDNTKRVDSGYDVTGGDLS